MIKQLLKTSLLALALTATVASATPVAASALPLGSADSFAAAGNIVKTTETKCGPNEVHPKEYNGDVDIRSCCPKSAGANANSMQCLFAKYVNPVVNLLAVGVGVIVVASVIAGGIQISSSAGDSGKYAKGRERIINSLLALAGFIFLYAFLQWIIPGGIIN
jgi:hypothetical protein